MRKIDSDSEMYDDWVRAKVDIGLAELNRGEQHPFDIDSLIDLLNAEG